MRKGSITVYLSLVLLLLASLLFASLEAGRITAGKAYLEMLSRLSADSAFAGYYYPLLEQYGLLGIDGAFGGTTLSKEELSGRLQADIAYGCSGMKGGLLAFETPSVTVLGCRTMLSGDGSEFLTQVRQLAVYEAAELAIEAISGGLSEAALVTRVYQEQETAQEAVAEVLEELLELMTLVDGIATKQGGIRTDKAGKPIVKDSFLKQWSKEPERELKEAFACDAVYEAIAPALLHPGELAAETAGLLARAQETEEALSVCEGVLEQCSSTLRRIAQRKLELAADKAVWEAKKGVAFLEGNEERRREADQRLENISKEQEALRLEEEAAEEEKSGAQSEKKRLEQEKKQLLALIKPNYEALQTSEKSLLALADKALAAVGKLEKKQKTAQTAVRQYESFLYERKGSVSEALLEGFLEELETLRSYAGLEEQGYAPERMRRTLEYDKKLLQELSLAGFQKNSLARMKGEMEAVAGRAGEYRTDGLWFSYGTIGADNGAAESAAQAMKAFASHRLLALFGVSEERLSAAEVSGKELPSALLSSGGFLGNLTGCMAELSELFSDGGVTEMLEQTGERVTDAAALELYVVQNFGCYTQPKEATKLCCEREYILFGQQTDESNLRSALLYLLALRTMMTFPALLGNAERQAQVQAAATAAVGFTGMPVLISIVKYALLLLWAVEEAAVEVAALLAGKKLSLLPQIGRVSFGELFLLDGAKLRAKADEVPDGRLGAGYSEYLTLLALLRGTKEKSYRAMDLIQENLRVRYRDSFRMANVVTEVRYEAAAILEQKFSFAGIRALAYRLKVQTEASYDTQGRKTD